MASIKGSDAKLFFNGAEIGTASYSFDADAFLERAKCRCVEIPSVLGLTFRGKFVPSPEFDAVMVGLRLRYGLRELHRNLGRYARWPYTN